MPITRISVLETTLGNLLSSIGVRCFTVGGRFRLECKSCRKRIVCDSQYIANELKNEQLVDYIRMVVNNHFDSCDKNPQLMIAKARIAAQPEPQKRPYSRRFEME